MKSRIVPTGMLAALCAALLLFGGGASQGATYFSTSQYDNIYSDSSGFHQFGVFNYWTWSWIKYDQAWGTSFADYWGVWWSGLDWFIWYQSQVAVGGLFQDALFRYEMD